MSSHRWEDARGRRGAQAALPVRVRRAVLTRDGVCTLAYPGCLGVPEEVDHTVPVAEGGTDEMDNLRAACKKCHRAKSIREAARGRKRYAERGRYPREVRPDTP